MKLTYDVAIIGGGLVGSFFAISLAKKNPKLNIVIFERSSIQLNSIDKYSINRVNRVYAISQKNVKALETLNCWPSKNVSTINIMDISGDAGGNIILDQNLVNRPYLAKIVESDNLHKLLFDKIKEIENITFIYEELKEIIAVESYVEIKTNNSTYNTNLIVGADGVNSFVRSYFNIASSQIKYNQKGVVADFECEYLHNNVAYQWFNNLGILAYLPLSNNKISIVWSTNNYEELLLQSAADFAKNAAIASNYKLGKLKLISKPASFSLKMSLVNSLYINKVVLIGDAAHSIHPLAGQGLNLGFGDAILLSDILGQYKNYQLSDVSILAKYNSLRMPEIRRMQVICHSLYTLFNSNISAVSSIRNIGLNTINSLNFIKKHLIKLAINY